MPKIPLLPPVSVLTGSEDIPLSQGGVTKRATSAQLASAFSSWTNTANSIVANYTVQTSDFGKTLVLGGNALFQLTFPAAGGFPSTFLLFAVNSDSWSGGRGKRIVSGAVDFPQFILWPGQTAIFFISAGLWRVERNVRAKLPPGAITFNSHFSSGNDTLGQNDGLGTGSSAFQTVSGALGTIADQFEFSLYNQTQLTVLAGANDSQEVHYPLHSGNPGAQGFASGPIIDGGGHTLSGGINLFFIGSYLQLRNVTITSPADGISLNHGGLIEFLDGITFGACSGAHISANFPAKIIFNNDYTISGGATAHMSIGNAKVIAFQGLTATFSANVTIGNTGLAVIYDAGGHVELQNWTWNLAGHTVTGKKYSVIDNGVVVGAAAIPGSIAGTTGSGGQIV